LNVREREREREPTRYLFFFDIFLLPWCTYVNVSRLCTHFYLFDVNKEKFQISCFSDRILINVDDQYEWKTTPKKPNRLHQYQ
jgi:hypothetical protein